MNYHLYIFNTKILHAHIQQNNKCTIFALDGNYSSYLKQKKSNYDKVLKDYKIQQTEIERLKRIADRFFKLIHNIGVVIAPIVISIKSNK